MLENLARVSLCGHPMGHITYLACSSVCLSVCRPCVCLWCCVKCVLRIRCIV